MIMGNKHWTETSINRKSFGLKENMSVHWLPFGLSLGRETTAIKKFDRKTNERHLTDLVIKSVCFPQQNV